ncbi:MAG: proprotein convertase P-domain-containing protein, partial [Planctomycetaceae bacterium]
FSSFGSAGGATGLVYVTGDGGDTWANPGSAGISGQNISGIAAEGGTIVVTSQSPGGIFRSTDAGGTFAPIASADFASDGATNFFDLVPDPTTPGRLYAAAEDTGIYRSDDFGLNWTKITGVGGGAINGALNADITNSLNNNLEMTVHPSTGRLYLGVVLAGQVGGIYYTSNGDQAAPTWIEMDVPVLPALPATTPTAITGAADDPPAPATPDGLPPIVITAAGHGLSTGDTVQVRNVGGNTNANGLWAVTVLDVNNVSLNGSPASGPAPYVASTGQIIRVTTPSPSFKDIDETGSQGQIHFSIGTDPNNHNLVFIGGDRQEQPNSIGDVLSGGSIFRGDVSIIRNPNVVPSPQWDHVTNNPMPSFDPQGGTASNSGSHAHSRDIAFDANGDLLESDDGGIFRRTNPQDNTGDWFSLAGNLGVVEYHSIAYDTNSDVILGGTQDNGTHVQNSPGSNLFSMFNGDDGGDVAVDAVSLAGASQSIRYHSSQFLSDFASSVWDASNKELSRTSRSLFATDFNPITPQFYTPIALNAVVPTSLILGGGNGVYESFNQGDTIDNAGAGVVATGSAAGPLAYGGFSAVNGDNRWVIYAGDADGYVHVRTEAAGPFTMSPDFEEGILDVEMNPNEWMEAFAVNKNSVRHTTDAGATWSNITKNLFTAGAGNVRSVQYIDGGAVDGLVVGTDQGLFATTIAHLGTWFSFGSGIPDIQIRDMDYDATEDLLILGTLGRGAWRLDNASEFLLPQVTLTVDTGIIPEDGSTSVIVTATMSRTNPDAAVIIQLDSAGTATFTETAGSGDYPDDYSRSKKGIIEIPAGVLTGFVTITALQDVFDEDDEVLQIGIASIVDTEAELFVRTQRVAETQTYNSTGATGIGDGLTVTNSITVPDTGVVFDLDVELDITHTETTDLTAVLVAPDGTRVELFNGVGPGGEANFTETMFDDSAATAIAGGTPPFTGSFRPSEMLSAFIGRGVGGDWTLEVTDSASPHTGILNSWSLTVDRTIEPVGLPEVTIIDDDALPTVTLTALTLTASPHSILEDGSTGVATITATLNTLSGRDVTVDLVLTGT